MTCFSRCWQLHPVDRLREIDVPVLFVNGRFDHVRAHAGRYLAATRNGRLVTVPGASHMVSVVTTSRIHGCPARRVPPGDI